MKTIYLIRHAKSSWSDPDLDDFERPLNKRGRRDLAFLAERLAELKVEPDVVLSSPATRAALTARFIADAIHYPATGIRYREAAYMAGIDGLLQATVELEEAVNTAIIVGHNPALTDFATYLRGREVEDIRTCGLFGAELGIPSWDRLNQGCGEMKVLEFPKREKKGKKGTSAKS
jgi:phosphohistidine phosphatase